jgi:hypothetical protein
VSRSRTANLTIGDLISRFLDNACPDHHVLGGSDHVRAQHTAMRLLDRSPELARANFYTAVVCGDLDRVTRALAADPVWATRPNGEPGSGRTDSGGEGDLVKQDWGTKGWEPLLYLCFTRLPLKAASDNAVAIARALLDHGLALPVETQIRIDLHGRSSRGRYDARVPGSAGNGRRKPPPPRPKHTP